MSVMNDIIVTKEDDYSAIFSKNDKRSIVNITPTKVSSHISTIPRDFLDMDKEELEKLVNPTRTDRALKAIFWREYNKAQLTETNMTTRGMWLGVCQEMWFYKHILTDNRKMAWILSPNVEDDVRLHLMYDKGLDRVEEILDSEITNTKGMLDPKKADVVLKAWKMLDDRVKGLAVQKIEKKSLSVKVSDGQVTHDSRQELIEKLQKKMIGGPEGAKLISPE